jgi:AcrR family transcriptional regulator
MCPAQSNAAKHQGILETAYALFKRSGYHATGIEQIIAASDVARMTMYRHFPSKDLLIVEVLQYRAKRFEAQLDRLAETAATPAEKTETIVGWYERWFHSQDFHGCVFAHALAEFGDPGHPVFEAAAEQKNHFKRRLRGILEEMMPPERADNAATALVMLLEGATLLAQMGQADAAMRAVRAAVPGIVAAPAVA